LVRLIAQGGRLCYRSPHSGEGLADRLPDNEFVIFGNSSHVTILEKEGDAYLAVVGDFVRRASAREG
jgi:pimeloyl-ACP methyl ester carboxylesterase